MPIANAQGADGKGSLVLQIADFTAGIMGAPNSYNVGYVKANQQQVSATYPGTYGCIAMPSGGLAPLPECQVWGLPDTSYSGAYYDATTGFPAQLAAGMCGTATEDRRLIFALRSNYAVTGYNAAVWLWDGASWSKPLDDSFFAGTDHGWLSGMLPFTSSFLNHQSPYATPGMDELIIASTWGVRDSPSPGEESTNVVLCYDMNQTSTSPNEPYFVMASGRTGLAFPDQLRTLFVETTGSRIYNLFSWIGDQSTNNDWILSDWGTNPGNPDYLDTPDFNSNQLIFQTNHASPISAVGIVTSGYFLVVTQDAGGYIVSGDIGESPYVTMAPGVQSTGSLVGQSCSTPLGLAYCALDNGMWVWDGGAVATKISMQLPDDFFTSSKGPAGADTSNYPQGYWYSCYSDGNWLYVSNSWIYDMVQNSWWQLKDQDDYPLMYYCEYPSFDNNNPTGRADWVYACPAVYNSQALNVGVKMSKSEPATQWQWKSNLIVLDEGYLVDINEVTMVCSGEGTFNITIAPIDGDGNTVVQAVPVTSPSTPQQIRFTCAARAGVLKVTIQAVSSSVTQVPMVLYDISLYTKTRYPVAINAG